MRKVLVIGIGAGDPEYVTMQAVNALNEASVFFVVGKGERQGSLLELRTRSAVATSAISRRIGWSRFRTHRATGGGCLRKRGVGLAREAGGPFRARHRR